jgi:flagellar hook-length control protein FliK
VTIDRLNETVSLTISASKQGFSLARIQLNPVSLGSVEVRLTQTTAGIVARVTAGSPVAAHTLQQGGAELKRQLEQAGVNVLKLDISVADQGATNRDPSTAGSLAQEQARAARQDSSSTAASAQDAPTPAQTSTTMQLSNGALIDVVA